MQFVSDKHKQRVTLGSLTVEEPCYGTSATAVERINNQQPKYIRITDFGDFGIEPNHKFMTVESYTEKHLLQNGDILFARTGATVGKTFYYDNSIGMAVFAGYCIRFRFDKNKVLPKFVYWYTKTNFYLNWVNGTQRPSGQPNINKEEYKSMEIILPNMEKQILLTSKMDDAFEIYKNNKKKADQLFSGTDKYVLDKLGIQIPEFENRLTCAVRLSDIKADKTMSCDYYHPERMALIHMMKEADIFDSRCLDILVDFVRDIVSADESNQDYLGLAGVASQTGELSGVSENAMGQAFKFKKGDILYARLRPYLNKVLLAETDGICSTEFHVMRIKNGVKILPEYLAAMMRSLIILSQTRHMMTGNTHPRISNDDVKKLIIPIPDIGIQKIISEEITRRKLEARRIRTEAELEWQAVKAQFEKELLGE